ncbi:MAG: hypothetical protein KKB59_10325 [Spirochaetes bacterium]|nr:hypothetical protein [Spirochaetota bacterium]
MSKNPKMRDRVEHYMHGETALDQKANGVRVTYADGTTCLVLNAILAPETAQSILLAAARPAVSA